MRAELIDQAELSVRRAKHDKPFPEKLDACRRATRLWNFLGLRRRNPIAPHELAHRRSLADLRKRLVFLCRKHSPTPRAFIAYANYHTMSIPRKVTRHAP